MHRSRLIDATSAGTAVFELEVGDEYSNSGGKIVPLLSACSHDLMLIIWLRE